MSPLREENVLIVGSGFSYHNLRAIPDRTGASEVFDKWLFESLCVSSPEERRERLLRWSDAPAARAAHPREEHLIPLMVCAGAAAGGECERVFSQKLPAWNIQTSCFEFRQQTEVFSYLPLLPAAIARRFLITASRNCRSSC